MCEVPPRSIQLRFIQKVQRELTATTDLWEYAVSKQWVAALQQFIEDDTKCGLKVPPLSATEWDDDNMYVGEKKWRVLASWYGVDSQYSFRRRSTECRYIRIQGFSEGMNGQPESMEYVLADNKLDFLTTFCCLLKDLSSDLGKLPFINIYFWESLDYVEFQLRCMLKVHPGKDVRLWLSFCDDGVEMLLEDISVYDQQHDSVGAILCGKYPELLGALQKRQGEMPAHMPQVIPGVTMVKEVLSHFFVSNLWQLTLCLEVLSPTVGAQSLASAPCPTVNAVPKAFLNLPLDHLFQAESKTQNSDWDEDLKRLLDDSVSGFSRLVIEQRDKVQMRTEQLLRNARESYLSLEQQVKERMEEVALKEKRLTEREKELNERDHELNSKLAKFKSMLTEFLMKKERFEKEAAQMAEQNSITASRVELNVGGVRYTTSIPTLLKEEGSTLQGMFRGQHALKPDTDGSYFIDRDGTHFRHILNFLRDGPASLQHLPQGDLHLLSELQAEAEHYQLHKMADALRVRMAESRAGGDYVSLPS